MRRPQSLPRSPDGLSLSARRASSGHRSAPNDVPCRTHTLGQLAQHVLAHGEQYGLRSVAHPSEQPACPRGCRLPRLHLPVELPVRLRTQSPSSHDDRASAPTNPLPPRRTAPPRSQDPRVLQCGTADHSPCSPPRRRMTSSSWRCRLSASSRRRPISSCSYPPCASAPPWPCSTLSPQAAAPRSRPAR